MKLGSLERLFVYRENASIMSVVGVDLGTLNTVIAVARNRGVDVVCSCHCYCPVEAEEKLTGGQITNEVSNRATPYAMAPIFTAMFDTDSIFADLSSVLDRRVDTSEKPRKHKKSRTSRTPSAL